MQETHTKLTDLFNDVFISFKKPSSEPVLINPLLDRLLF